MEVRKEIREDGKVVTVIDLSKDESFTKFLEERNRWNKRAGMWTFVIVLLVPLIFLLVLLVCHKCF